MKKRNYVAFVPFIIFSLALFGCDTTQSDTSQDDSSNSEDTSNSDTSSVVNNSSTSNNTSYTVTFDLNYSGSSGAPAQQIVQYGGLVNEPAAPTRENYDFVNWSTSIYGSPTWNFATDTVTQNMTLYAVWTTKAAQSKAFYVDIPEFWKGDGGAVSIYAWEGGEALAPWPGVRMNNVAGDVYVYTLSMQYTNFIFARVSPNEPLTPWNSQTASLSFSQAGNNNLYIIGETIVWHDNNDANVCSGTWSVYGG